MKCLCPIRLRPPSLASPAVSCHAAPPQDSFLDEGFILDKRIGVGQPKRIENARILVANTGVRAPGGLGPAVRGGGGLRPLRQGVSSALTTALSSEQP